MKIFGKDKEPVVVEKQIDYKYSEDRTLKELAEYIDATYNQHYSQNKFQATEFILDSGHGTGFTIGSAVIAEAELEQLDGITAGTVAASKAVVVDANKDVASFRNVTLTGELDAATGDFSGDVDIDGTLEADAITVNGTALNTVIADEATALAIALG